jgi:2-dehydropantoate 2-reductase
MMDRLRVAVVGAGAVGGWLAARLHWAGASVVLVGRPRQVEVIRRAGLEVRQGRQKQRYWIAASERLDEVPDLLLLAVKTQDLAAACRAVLPYRPRLAAVTLQNGLRADAIAADLLGPELVVGGVVVCAATHLEPGKLSVEVPGWLVLGAPAGQSSQRARQVAGLLGAAVPTYLSDNLAGARWAKLIANLNNALSAATGLPLAAIARDRTARLLPVYVMREGHRVARAAGVRFDHHLYGLGAGGPRLAMVALLQRLVSGSLATLPPLVGGGLLAAAAHGPLGRLELRGSTWQSLARGRPTEIDYLNGEIVRLGRAVGVPTPFNGRLVAVVHEVERSGRFRSPAELWPTRRREPAEAVA